MLLCISEIWGLLRNRNKEKIHIRVGFNTRYIFVETVLPTVNSVVEAGIPGFWKGKPEFIIGQAAEVITIVANVAIKIDCGSVAGIFDGFTKSDGTIGSCFNRKAVGPGVTAGNLFPIEYNGKIDGIAIQMLKDKTGFLNGLLNRDGLREKIDADLKPGSGCAFHIADIIGIFEQSALSISTASEANVGVIQICRCYARPVDFMLVFRDIDANKRDYIAYYELAMQHLALGGYIIADNTLWDGKVADPACHDAQTCGIREFNDRVASDSRVERVIVPLRDGLTIIRFASDTESGQIRD